MKMETATFVFTQDPDSCSSEYLHELNVKIEDAGGGKYIVFDTVRWSLNPDELQVFVEELLQALHTVERHDQLIIDGGAKNSGGAETAVTTIST